MVSEDWDKPEHTRSSLDAEALTAQSTFKLY